jgi:hypothetical protein
MSTFFRGITETVLSLFRGIFSERNSVSNPIHSSEPTDAISQSHRLSLSSFWREDPEGWFHFAEAKFIIANLLYN